MKTCRIFLWLLLGFWLAGTSPVWCQPAGSDDPNREALKSLLEDLSRKIEDADERMVAHPSFLEELRGLVERYQRVLREIFLLESFKDGDYTRNPRWVVDSGQFRVTSDSRLASTVPAEKPVSPAPPTEDPGAVESILKGVMKELAKQQEEKPQATSETTEAAIHTLTRLGPFFEMDMTFVSNSDWGAMEIVLLGGDPPAARYRMVYHAAPSPDRPIQMIRERESRSYIIESATAFPDLDDGSLHKFRWVRDDQGRMRVLVDGEVVIDTVELFYRDDFSGLALVNRGGTYAWGPIKVQAAPEAETD